MADYVICGDSQIGLSHTKTGAVCQDSHFFGVRHGIAVAAVADGLGSSRHSDVASEIAARVAVEYCIKELSAPHQDVTAVIRRSFDEALFRVKLEAKGALDDYDTTLSLAVLIQDRVFYGHSGDGAVIALRSDGFFESITRPQQGEGVGKEKTVFPLAAESRWVFGEYPYAVKALFLVTDGVLNKMMPPLLENQPSGIDHRYLYYLFRAVSRLQPGDADGWIAEEVAQITPNESNHDDKTLLIMVSNDAGFTKQPGLYYEYPSDELWKQLKVSFDERLYPYREQPGSEDSLMPPGEPSAKPAQPFSSSATPNSSIKMGILPKTRNKTWVLLLAILVIAAAAAGISIRNSRKRSEERQARFEDSILVPDLTLVYDGLPHGLSAQASDEEFRDFTIQFASSGLPFGKVSPTATLVRETPLKVDYIVSYQGLRDFTGSATLVILPVDLSGARIDPIEPAAYTGQAITPPVPVSLNGNELLPGSDYDIRYAENIYPGTATAAILPVNENYTGGKKVQFIIEKATPRIEIPDLTFALSDADVALTNIGFAQGMHNEPVGGQVLWFLTEAREAGADGDSLPRRSGETVELFWTFQPNAEHAMIYNSVKGTTRFTAISKEDMVEGFMNRLFWMFNMKWPDGDRP